MHAQAAGSDPMVGSTSLGTEAGKAAVEASGENEVNQREQTECEVKEPKKHAVHQDGEAGQQSGSDSRQDVPQDRTLERLNMGVDGLGLVEVFSHMASVQGCILLYQVISQLSCTASSERLRVSNKIVLSHFHFGVEAWRQLICLKQRMWR